MKKLVITLIAAIASTHAVQARDWMWFHGDIGLSSAFASSTAPAKSPATGTVTKKKVVTKSKATSGPSVAASKSKSSSHRITAR